jgi:hypothetical protein
MQDQRLHAHHILLEQIVLREAPERQYDLANRMLLGERCCHAGHHGPGVKDTRLDFACVPSAAVLFAVEVIGEGPAEAYFQRRYRWPG